MYQVGAHGDDFGSLGARFDLDWLRGVIRRRRDVKFKSRLQWRKQGAVRTLNRIATGEGRLGVRGGPESRGDLDGGHEDRRGEQRAYHPGE